MTAVPTPPKPVGEEMSFQVPELEQLHARNYIYAGKCKVLRDKEFFEFCVLLKGGRLLAAHAFQLNMQALQYGQRLKNRTRDNVPIYGNHVVRVVPLTQLPEGHYLISGNGSIVLPEDTLPTVVYIVKKIRPIPDRNFFAITPGTKSLPLPLGCSLEVERFDNVLGITIVNSLGLSTALDENLQQFERLMYEWENGRLTLKHSRARSAEL